LTTRRASPLQTAPAPRISRTSGFQVIQVLQWIVFNAVLDQKVLSPAESSPAHPDPLTGIPAIQTVLFLHESSRKSRMHPPELHQILVTLVPVPLKMFRRSLVILLVKMGQEQHLSPIQVPLFLPPSLGLQPVVHGSLIPWALPVRR